MQTGFLCKITTSVEIIWIKFSLKKEKNLEEKEIKKSFVISTQSSSRGFVCSPFCIWVCLAAEKEKRKDSREIKASLNVFQNKKSVSFLT